MQPNVPDTNFRYVPAVDGLRALAVLSVIAFHLDPAVLPGGFVGVDIFFVISGFVVTGSLIDLRFSRLIDLLSYFYARRFLRILPALIVMLTVSIVLFVAFVPESWLSSTSKRVAKAAFLGVSNVVLALHTDDYFAPRPAFNPFTHTWSLGVEEQFYFVFPFLFYWHQQRLAAGRSGRPMLLVIAALTLGSLALCAVLTAERWRFAFYLMPARFWELGTGMLLCLTMQRWRPRLAAVPDQRARMLGGSAVGAIAIAFAVPAGTYFPFPLAMLPVLGTAALIAHVCARKAGMLHLILSSPPAVTIGKMSYSLYLWHWPTFVLLRWTIGIEGLAGMLLALALAFTLAAASYQLVELPTRRYRRGGALPRARIITAGLAILGGSAAGASAVLDAQSRLSLSQTSDTSVWYPDDRQAIVPSPSQCALSYGERPLATGTERVWTPVGCGTRPPFGRLFVVGDSHSLAYVPMLRQTAADLTLELRMYHLSDCPYVNFKEPLADNHGCAAYYAALTAVLGRELRSGDALFMPSLKMPRLINQWTDAPDLPTLAERQQAATKRGLAAEEARILLSSLAQRGARIVLEAPKPVLRSPPFRCSDWFNRMNPACRAGFSVPRDLLDVFRLPTVRAMVGIGRAVPSVSIWDPFSVLCPGRVCYATRAGKPLFFDGDHVSGYANKVLYPSFRQHMEAVFEHDGARRRNAVIAS